MNLYKLLHPILLSLMKAQRKQNLRFLNSKPELKGNVIYAMNHSTKNDVPIAAELIQEHVWILAGIQRLKAIDRICLLLNGAVWVDRKNKEDWLSAKMCLRDKYEIPKQYFCRIPATCRNG